MNKKLEIGLAFCPGQYSFLVDGGDFEGPHWKIQEFECLNEGGYFNCPCYYNETYPIINFRGLCPDTLVEHSRYNIKQLTTDPEDIFFVGYQSASITYRNKQWVLSDSRKNVTAKTNATQKSYALGKNNWTISGDRCSGAEEYATLLKLSACKEDEFTCNDGHCVKMKKRCDQLKHCSDGSDEMGCKLLDLDEGYNKLIPPLLIDGKAVLVNVSLILHKIVAINEEELSIELQYEITLKWKENRVNYHNLREGSYLNVLTEKEVGDIWLPLVIYNNTDQLETTRLGAIFEWSTSVMVKREGNFTRSGVEEIDEAEIFKEEENSLVMTQIYTHEFQCVYQLERYPFDTQVELGKHYNNKIEKKTQKNQLRSHFFLDQLSDPQLAGVHH